MIQKMNVLIVGPQASGKGTQAKKIADLLQIPHISTGDIFRDNIKNGTELGNQVVEYTNNGKLVPDALVIQIIRDRLSRADCAAGFILDGFPRTVPQAQALDQITHIGKVVVVDVPDEVCIKRISGRYMASNGTTYNVYTSPKPTNATYHPDGTLIEAFDDVTGEKLLQRDDDKPEKVRQRLADYHAQTKPIIAHYGKIAGTVIMIDGQQDIDAVFDGIRRALGQSAVS